jgi:hypothetical protein
MLPVRVLFSTPAGAGHFGPMVPVAHACAAAATTLRWRHRPASPPTSQLPACRICRSLTCRVAAVGLPVGFHFHELNPCRIKGADKVSAPERLTGSVRQVYNLAEGIAVDTAS